MLLVQYLEKKKEELEKSIHPTYPNTLKNYIKLKIEMLEWFQNLASKNDKDIRVLRIKINDNIRYYKNQKNDKDLSMVKMVQYNDRIKCLESLLIIPENYNDNNNIDDNLEDELISIFD